MRLLHILTASPSTPEQADDILRAFRRLVPPALLFCDLSDADAAKLPQDDDIVRRLQSGVMALDARTKGSFLLLVRRRIWSDAARCYLGASQPRTPQRVSAELLIFGQTPCIFEAATFTPGALRHRFDAVLFSSSSLSCTPETPAQMIDQLPKDGCLRAMVVPRCLDNEPLLSRLPEFTLSAPRAALNAALKKRGLALMDAGPVLFSKRALAALAVGQMALFCPLAENCVFVRRQAPSLHDLFQRTRLFFTQSLFIRRPFHFPLLCALVPLVQILMLSIAALLGFESLALAALLLPEIYAFFSPDILPGALLRTVFLPMLAVLSLDALTTRLFARARIMHIRILKPSTIGCSIFGVLLIAASLIGIHALVPCFLAGLLFLSAPLFAQALSLPAREHIPLQKDEADRLQKLAVNAFADIQEDTPVATHMLALCGGCMLGLLEPDEAARRIESMTLSILSPAALACALASAQFLRERMAHCDAALRPLPASIETHALIQPFLDDGGPLSYILHHGKTTLRSTVNPLDALFLPRRLSASASPRILTHPHAFLRESDMSSGSSVERFLFYTSVLLNAPFEALLWRSPAAAPYWPLLSLIEEGQGAN